jgi:hypothetical protein
MRIWIVAVALSTLPTAAFVPAASAASAHNPPNACKTFTVESVDKLFGINTKTHLHKSRTSSGSGNNKISECLVTHGTKALTVETSLQFGGSGGAPSKTYRHPQLGRSGQVAVARKKSSDFTDASYEKHSVFLFDSINVTESHKGHRLFRFALAQSKAFHG